ncbi:hypothetical protein BDV18DRAFT_141187 [Aspergillus unguis]
MAETLALLNNEVERLVNAPYAPSLQDIYSLTQQAPSTAVACWVAQKPCQIGPLVDVLVDSLSRSRFALPLLTSFAQAQEFRDGLLTRHPYLLDQFLQQCTGENSTHCLPTCLSLLSSPLPCGIIPPASLAPFVMQMIEGMKVKPCVETVRPLYLISSCLQATGVLYELPEEVMSSFQIELTKTLRNLNDHMGNLLCLATFARLVSFQCGNDPTDKGLETPTWLQSIKHFFGEKRGLKTLDLVVLRVILACSSNYGNLTAEESAESIRLAISICESVDKPQRKCWIEGNSVKLAKLHEKINREGIDYRVKMLGISFLFFLTPAATLPSEMSSQLLEWLVSGNASEILGVLPAQVVPRLVVVLTANTEQSASVELLQYAISSLSADTTGNMDPARVQVSKLVLQGLRDSHLNHKAAMFEPYGQTIHSLVGKLPEKPSEIKCDGAVLCHASVMKLKNNLLSDLLAFWIEATLPRDMETGSFSPIATTLINVLTRSTTFSPEAGCISSRAKPLDLRTGLITIRTHEMTDVSRSDWRTDMKSALISSSQTLNDGIMRKVDNICYDLEQRCGSIEAPLRAAEKERTEYYLEAEQMKAHNQALGNQLQEASSTIMTLQQEMSRLAGHADSATGRVDELSATLAQVRDELEELRRTSQDTLSNERESARSRELDIIASLTEKDERLDELQEEIKCQGEANEELKENLASALKDKESFLEETAAMKNDIMTLTSELEQSRETLTQKDERILQLSSEKDGAEESAKELQNKLREEIGEAESLRNALEETTERFRVELEELRRESELQSSRMAAEATERNSEIISLQRAIHEAKSDATKDLQAKERRIQHLERKVQHLRDERAAKAREFSEAQQHISRLMGVMGFKPPASSDDRVSNKQRSRPSTTQSPATLAQTETQTESGDGIFQSGEEDLATSMEVTTPRPAGRSPKRSRHSAFPSAQPSPARSHESNKKSRDSVPRGSSKKHQERRPLGETDHNSQPNSQRRELMSCDRRGSFQDSQFNRQTDQNRLNDIDLDLSLEFSKDFVFTSTSMSELNGHAQ